MSKPSTITRSDLVLRWMIQQDLHQVEQIGHAAAGLDWDREDFLSALRAINTVGHVAEIGNEVAGFLLYRIQREPEIIDTEAIRNFWGIRLADQTAATSRALQIDLVNLGLATAWRRHGIGRAMLNKLDLKIQREGGVIRAIVPETRLAMQLFLRQAGYQASRVLREHFDGEDGYLMERWARKM